MRQECIDTIETSTAPLLSWGQWLHAGTTLVKQEMLQVMQLYFIYSERSHQRFMLERLSDEGLKDIGYSRADVENECSKPFWKK